MSATTRVAIFSDREYPEISVPTADLAGEIMPFFEGYLAQHRGIDMVTLCTLTIRALLLEQPPQGPEAEDYVAQNVARAAMVLADIQDETFSRTASNAIVVDALPEALVWTVYASDNLAAYENQKTASRQQLRNRAH